MDGSAVRRLPVELPRDGAGARAAVDLVPRRCTLSGFTEEAAITDGVNVREAEPLVAILVTTRNSLYRIIPLRRGNSDVLIQGGTLFPEPTEARLAGATFGGSLLKMHWIAVGMRMEIDAGRDDGPIVTTRVANVRIEREKPTVARPH